MRPPVVLALCALPLAVAVAAPACGGAAFTSAPDDGGLAPADAPHDVALGATASFCALEAGTHTFCDDFDGPPLSSKWDTIDDVGGGTAVIDSAISYSPPDSFKSIAPGSAGEVHGRIIKAFGTASRVVVAFEVSLDSTPVKLGAGVLGGDSIVGIDVGANYSIGIAAHTDEVSYFEDTTNDAGLTVVTSSKDLVATPTLKGWTEIVLTVDIAHANLSVAIDGVQILAGAPITPPSGQTVSVLLGAYSRNQASALAAHFDNVTVDITP